jgi:ATP-binding cassette, subfamily B, multidrug efflux pump
MRGVSLWSYLAPHKTVFWSGAALLLATNAFEKAIPWLLKRGVDALSADDWRLVQESAVWVFGLALAMLATRSFSRILIFNVGRDVEYTLRNQLLAKLHVLGAPFVMRRSVGDIMSRATNDLGQVRLLLGFGGLNLVNASVAWVSALALMLAISPKLTFYALLPYPLFMLITRAFARRLFRVSQASQEVLGQLAERVQEYLSGVRLVRAYAIEGFESERFGATNRLAVERTMAMVSLRALMVPVLMCVGALGTLLVLYFGGRMIIAGELTKGELLAFYAYLAQLIWPTMAAGYLLSILQRGRASYARVRELLDAEPEIAEAAQAAPLGRDARGRVGRGQLVVSHLSFAYGQRKVLDDVSFRLEPGESLAIMGRTGSGKTTLAALLARLLPTPEGSVYLDGRDVTELRLSDLRRAVGYAQQESFLFSTTVGRNIGFSLAEPDSPEGLAAVAASARDAAILDEVERLPDGLDTVVGERGVQLSGGQKQRVALARALLNEPSVLVLDDPLSAVDAKTERSILAALDRAAQGRTMILITNRAAAAAHCDQVIVLEAGRVIEQGAPRTLLRAHGAYAALNSKQTLEQELASL